MKLTFFGTAAAEGFPGLFCNCKYCQKARELGGKNIRGRSQALIDGDLLIDMPPDTMTRFQMHGIRGDKLTTVLFTHGHGDHYFPANFILRIPPYAHDMEVPVLDVLCPETVYNDLVRIVGEGRDDLRIHKAVPYETVELNGYEITPMKARHDFSRSAVIYVIAKGGKRMLYAHDTGYFYDEVFEYVESKGLYFDLATFDCTYAHLPASPTESHMDFDNVGRVIERLRSIGAVNGDTRLFVNHFSHNGNPLHEDMEVSAAKIGCEVSFDGCSVDF
jgi:phosphoribosyl 1,2-cyclic phosphate phosphodiesterase